jgi:hypothetical protein
MNHVAFMEAVMRVLPGLAVVMLGAWSFASLPLTNRSLAQEVRPRPYDGIQAGLDAFQLGEERRQANLQSQIQANDAARAAAGLPTTRGETIFYYDRPYASGPVTTGYRGVGVGVVPWDAAYGYGFVGSPYGASPYGASVTYGRFGRRATAFGVGPLFEPWPYVPGDIYGWRTFSTVRQPIGQTQIQTGENRWESHPVYDPPLPNHRPTPPVDSPLLNNTPFDSRPVEAADSTELPPPPPQPTPPRSRTARDF